MRKKHNNTKRQRQLRRQEAEAQFSERQMGLSYRKRAMRRLAKMSPADREKYFGLTEKTTEAAIA
jgi:hypothetical protein